MDLGRVAHGIELLVAAGRHQAPGGIGIGGRRRRVFRTAAPHAPRGIRRRRHSERWCAVTNISIPGACCCEAVDVSRSRWQREARAGRIPEGGVHWVESMRRLRKRAGPRELAAGEVADAPRELGRASPGRAAERGPGDTQLFVALGEPMAVPLEPVQR